MIIKISLQTSQEDEYSFCEEAVMMARGKGYETFEKIKDFLHSIGFEAKDE